MVYVATIAMTVKCADGMYLTMSVCAKKKLHIQNLFNVSG